MIWVAVIGFTLALAGGFLLVLVGAIGAATWKGRLPRGWKRRGK